MLVPTSWHDITLGVYENVHGLRPVTYREYVSMLAKMCSIDENILRNWPSEIFDKILQDVSFIFKDSDVQPTPVCKIGEDTYVVATDERITLGEWVDADEAQKNGESVISNVLAIVCRPVGEIYDPTNNENRQRMFSDQPISNVQGVMSFFLQCSQLLKSTTTSFLTIQAAAALLPLNIKHFLKPGGGIRLFRIWRIIIYYGLMLLLRYRLARFSHSCNTKMIKKSRKRHSAISINN